MRKFLVVLLTLVSFIAGAQDTIIIGGKPCGIHGSSKESSPQYARNAFKNRFTFPKEEDFVSGLRLDNFVDGTATKDKFSEAKAVELTGYVFNIKPGGQETCNCGTNDLLFRDTHIELTLNDKETGPEKRFIIEVTPRIRRILANSGIDWTTESLRENTKGHLVKVQGWLFYDSSHQTENFADDPNDNIGRSNWRATSWEIHPVTSIEVLDELSILASKSVAPVDMESAEAAAQKSMQLNILKSGVRDWNTWRLQNDKANIDLSDVDLSNISLRNADLHGADLSDADLSNTDLGAADLGNANLSGANLHNANLSGANLRSAKFTNSKIGYTVFGLTNLSTSEGLETVEVDGPCSIDLQTMSASKGIPKSFLLKIGVPERPLECLSSCFKEDTMRLYPVFLSHSPENKDIAWKLYEALIAKGVNVFYDEKNAMPTEDGNTGSPFKEYNGYYKTILICSKKSLSESWWINSDLEHLFAKEQDLFNESKQRVQLLIPVAIDNFITKWSGPNAEAVRRYPVRDFKNWKEKTAFENALNQLIQVLGKDRRPAGIN